MKHAPTEWSISKRTSLLIIVALVALNIVAWSQNAQLQRGRAEQREFVAQQARDITAIRAMLSQEQARAVAAAREQKAQSATAVRTILNEAGPNSRSAPGSTL